MAAEWIFDPVPPSGAIRGGNPVEYVFDSDLRTFVREVLQNAHDQKRPGEELVTVDFDLVTLSGNGLRAFLDALGWDRFSRHLEGSAERQNQHARLIRRALDALEETRELRLMRITDTGTRGLTGDEDAPGTNYTALVRNVLDTAEDGRARGGSHGLGKALLWALSSFGMVLFHSNLIDQDVRRGRFVGRADLPHHETDDDLRWGGPGWFGRRDPAIPERAISLWNGEAEDLAAALFASRAPSDSTGTTIVVVGFNEPHEDEPRSEEDIMTDVERFAVESFWPAIERGSLRIRLRQFANGDLQSEFQVEEAEVVQYFARAFELPSRPKSVALEAGDSATRDIEVTFPGRFDSPTSTRSATVRLGVVRSEEVDVESDLDNTIALVRGAGMVVQYRRPRRRPGGERFHAVLRTGEAFDDSEASRHLESFLRAAEPPAHNEWHGNTNRMANEYHRGGKAALARIFAAIDDALVEMCRVEPPKREEGPERLKKLFSIATGPGKRPEHGFHTHFGEGTRRDGQWHLEASVERLKGSGPWKAAVQVLRDGESGRGQPLTITMVQLPDGALASAALTDGLVRLDMPAACKRTTFKVVADDGDIPAGLEARTTIRLKVDPEAVK